MFLILWRMYKRQQIMPKRGIIFLGMELEPNPFIGRGNIDESVDALDYCPCIR